jgi:N-acetylneuraminic acid mutarotase
MLAFVFVAGSCTRTSTPPSSATSPSSASSGPAAHPPSVTRLSVSLAPYRLPESLQRSVAVDPFGVIYVAGGLEAAGTSSRTVFSLDPSTGRVRVVGRLARAVHDAAAAVIRGRLFVFGGGPNTGTDVVQSFDLSSGRSIVVGRLPTVLSDVASVRVGDSVYLIGGYDDLRPQNTVYRTADGTTFDRVGTLPVGLRYAAVAAMGSSIVVAGGVSAAGPVSSVYSFDTVTRKVRTIGRLPVKLGHAAAFSLGDAVFVVGGRTASDVSLRTVFAILPSGRIVRLPPIRFAVADAATVSDGAEAWLIGGWRGRAIDNIYRFTRAAS